MIAFSRLVLLFALTWMGCFAQEIRLVRSNSGPSGHVSGAKFVFDEIRARFVFPRDNALTIFFEWTAPPGLHTLSAIWKDPSGKPVSISPDVKIETKTNELNAYWTYEIAGHMASGIWTADIKVDGQPAGSHVFELVVPPPAPAKSVEAEKPPAPTYLTLDQIFRKVSPSLVTIHKLDGERRPVDTALGFVLAPGVVATAFQAIDGGTEFEVVFADGRKIVTERVSGMNRLQDWALLSVETEAVVPVEKGPESGIVIGERLIVFNIENEARTIGGIDISGRSDSPGFGPRIQFAQSLAKDAIGGPLLDSLGRAVALMGGSTVPGSRLSARVSNYSPALFTRLASPPAAIPLSLIGAPGTPRSTAALITDGQMTEALYPIPDLIYGATSSRSTKNASDPLPPDASDFSRRDPEIFVYTMWSRKSKDNKGSFAARVYDANNKVRYQIAPKKLTIPSETTRLSFSIAPSTLEAGIYRIDLIWNDRAVWRTMIRIAD